MSPPRITLLVLAFQQAEYIEAAVTSALAQTGEPIEILLSDDASSDDTFAKMQALAAAYRGPHRIRLHRSERNLGIGSHYNRLIAMAEGQLLVTQAGDDISLPHRVATLAHAWDQADRRPDLVASHLFDMDVQGRDHGVLRVDDLADWCSVTDWQVRRPFVIGAAHAFTKRLHQRFGPFVDGLTYEDQANVLRALGAGGAISVPEALVRYRRGGLSSGARRLDGAQFLAWTKRRNVAHLALHEQWLTDAAVMDHFAAVQQATQREHDRERYIARLLQTRHRAALWREACCATHLPLAWRLRKALHHAYPGLAARRLARVR